MHCTNLAHFSAEEIVSLVDNASAIKKQGCFQKSLSDKTLYMLFQKTSTRTALSFAEGMAELGGRYFSQNWDESNFSVGEIVDEIRYVATSADIVMARLKKHQDIELLARSSPVPVINGCCDKFHPCQAIADILTIKEIFGSFDVKLLYVGIRNNIYNSLVTSLPRIGGTLYTLTPIVNEVSLDEHAYVEGKRTGRFHEVSPDVAALLALLKEVDIVYVDTWVDMEFFNRNEYGEVKKSRTEAMMPFQLNEAIMEGSRAIVMHDMPIHAGFEITRGVVESHIDTILHQADNRKHGQKAILLKLLEDDQIRGMFRKCQR